MSLISVAFTRENVIVNCPKMDASYMTWLLVVQRLLNGRSIYASIIGPDSESKNGLNLHQRCVFHLNLSSEMETTVSPGSSHHQPQTPVRVRTTGWPDRRLRGFWGKQRGTGDGKFRRAFKHQTSTVEIRWFDKMTRMPCNK